MYKLEEFIHRLKTRPKKSMTVTLDKNLQIPFSNVFFFSHEQQVPGHETSSRSTHFHKEGNIRIFLSYLDDKKVWTKERMSLNTIT